MIRQEDALDRFDYIDGELINKHSRVGVRRGSVAGGSDCNDGYKRVTISRRLYPIHRIIWIMHNGAIKDGLQIDHINGIRDDNRIENLRLVTQQENNYNTKAKGYSWNKNASKFVAFIRIKGKKAYLGSFDDEEDASNAYIKAKKEHHVIGAHNA